MKKGREGEKKEEKNNETVQRRLKTKTKIHIDRRRIREILRLSMCLFYKKGKHINSKGGAANLKVGGQCIGRWGWGHLGVNTVKPLKLEKGASA